MTVEKKKKKYNNEASRRWRAKNPGKMKELCAAWYLKNKEKVAKQAFRWRTENPERYKETQAKRYRENKPEIQRKATIRQRERYNDDENFRIAHILRARLTSSIKGQPRAGSFVRDLGCSIPELVDHLEKQFQPGMNWENHTKNGWHIDHIIPLNTLDLTNREQFLKACHYTNLRPIWAIENMSRPKDGSDILC